MSYGMTDARHDWDHHDDLEDWLERLWRSFIEDERELAELVDDFVEWWTNRRRHVSRLVVTIHTTEGEQVSPVAVQIVDTDTGAKATASWVDQAGLPMATRPANAAPLVFSTDVTSVATCVTDATNPDQGDIKEVGLGDFNVLVAAPLDVNGNPMTEADGLTPIPAPAPTPATVVNSAAGGLTVAVTA